MKVIKFIILLLGLAVITFYFLSKSEIKFFKNTEKNVSKNVEHDELSQVEPRKTIDSCTSCGGDGRIGSGKDAKTCPVCNGSGYVGIVVSNIETVVCPPPPEGCGGVGRIRVKEKINTRTGKEVFRYRSKKCELCDGKGYRSKAAIK